MPAESDPEGGSEDGCERARAPSCGAARPAGERAALRRAPAPDPGRYRTRDCLPPCRRHHCETATLARWLAPAAHPLPLCEGTHRVVEPRDLLDATHRP